MAPRVPKKKIVFVKSAKDQEVLHALFANDHVPTWQDYEKMSAFLSVRGRILPKNQTRITSKQQRQLAGAIKQARHLGLLPFVVGA